MNKKLKSVQFITVTFIIICLIYPYFPGKNIVIAQFIDKVQDFPRDYRDTPHIIK